ncbi:hypothetical protein NSTCB13_00240 [Nostoc sp. DSM 114160]
MQVNERYKLNLGIRKRFIKPVNNYQAHDEGFQPSPKRSILFMKDLNLKNKIDN